jgi:hypothetical protein
VRAKPPWAVRVGQFELYPLPLDPDRLAEQLEIFSRGGIHVLKVWIWYKERPGSSPGHFYLSTRRT